MTPIAWVVENSLLTDERFRHLTVGSEEFRFEFDGKKCQAIKGQCHVITDKSGQGKVVMGIWREDGK